MASSLSLSLFLVLTSLTIFFHLSHSATQILQPQGSSGIHLYIKKNSTSHTHQYYTTLILGDRDPSTLNIIRNEVKVVIDLSGQLTWIDCDQYNSTSYRPIRCGSRKCSAAKGIGCVGCNRSPPRPGCTNNTCGSYAFNPLSNKLYSAGLGEDLMEVYSTDGKSEIVSNTVPEYPFSCGDSSQLKGLAFGTIGMVGLARSKTSLPAQIAAAIKLPHPDKFALCIPSSTKTGFGDIFIGGGPYYMFPFTKDLSKLLVTTPLLINPVSTAPIYPQGDASDEYFIDVKFIRVDGVRLGSLNASLLAIDKQGNGGTKLSTVAPHTILQSSIYQSVVNKFVKAAASKKIKRVASVSPFGACFDSKTIGTSKTGPDVPIIDLVFQKGVYWRIYGANSMVRVNNGTVLCLGFMDGGAKPRTSVVIGGHQLENYLLEFDLGSSMLGFSSSLLVHDTNCSHNRFFQ